MTERKQALRIVIVGGVAGGASAAARARRVNSDAEITVLEKGSAVSFANCGLPYHIGGEIEERDKLLVASPELFWNRFRIDVRTEHEVTHIDRQTRTVSGQKSGGEPFSLEYDRLILATGSEPIRPDFCSADHENVFQLWTLQDMDAIIAYMKQRPCRTATVIGAGYVGLEVVEQLARLGIQVTVVERLPQVLGPLDAEMARLIELELEREKIELRLGASVAGLLANSGKVTAVQLENGDALASDLVIVGVGVRPRVKLAESVGLTIGKTGGVRINEFCQTDDPHIYAVGDMVEYHHGTADQHWRIPLAGPANRAGRIAGTHAASGSGPEMSSVQGTAVVRVFGLGAAGTGLNTRMCQMLGIEHRAVIVQAPHHAGYFPGAKSLTVKLLYAAGSGKVLGCQAVGAAGVDKRIDVVATLLHFGGTVHDLAGLDLAYAPPYGSAKDPLHMAAFAAQNDLDDYPTLLSHDADLDNKQVVDVRTSQELERLPLEGAMHIPIDELSERWQELDPSLPTVAVCHSGKRAHIAACWLRGNGFNDVANLSGGMSIRRLHQTTESQQT